jgi:hypothetical protein
MLAKNESLQKAVTVVQKYDDPEGPETFNNIPLGA